MLFRRVRQTLHDLEQLSLGSHTVSPLPHSVVKAAACQLRSERGDADPTCQWEACQGCCPVGEGLGGGLVVVEKHNLLAALLSPVRTSQHHRPLTGSASGSCFINVSAAA